MAISFQNQATLTFGETTVVSNITTGTIEDAVAITKRALVETYGTGCPVTYILSIENRSENALSGLTVTDNLGAYTLGTTTLYPLTYVDGAIRQYRDGLEVPPPTAEAGPPLVLSGISVTANGSTIIVYQAKANEFAPRAEGDTIINTATLTGNDCVRAEDNEVITVLTAPSLSVIKELTPAVLGCGDPLTYTFTLENFGNTSLMATDDAVLRDTFTPPLTNLTVTYGGTPWTEGTEYTYDEVTGEFATVAGYITVPSATFVQDPVTGQITTTPGIRVLRVSGSL